MHREPVRRAAPIVCDHEYAQRALDRAATTVAHAPDGTRNNTLNRAAYRMGRLVETGATARHTVENALEAAAVASGLSVTESRATIASGLNASGRRGVREIGRATDARRALEPTLSREL